MDDSEEMKYRIVLSENVASEKQLSVGEVVEMTHPKSKRHYYCVIPKEKSKEDFEEDHEEERILSPQELLEPLSNSCLYRLAGWWTYEFCFGEKIQQYHQENNKPIRPQDMFVLGRYDSSAEGVEYENYYSEKYVNGDVCDITGEPRVTEVQYYCSNDRASSAISEIKEPASCQYTFIVHTPLLCKHPKYQPKKENVEIIVCYPTKSQQEWETDQIEKDMNEFDEDWRIFSEDIQSFDEDELYYVKP